MRRVAFAVFSTIAGLVGLLSFKTHPATISSPAAAVSTVSPSASSTGSASPTGSTSSSSTSSSSTSSSASSSAGTTAKTYTGDSTDTRWGPVQVRIVVTNGKVTSVAAVVYPTQNGRDQEINATAIPTLNSEALAAGSAKIDTVSGATVTSDGYIGSLQSALDKAGLS